MFCVVKCLEYGSESDDANKLLIAILDELIENNSGADPYGVASPYCSPEDVLERVFEFKGQKNNFRESSGSSYVLEPLIDVFARRSMRDIVDSRWRKITHIHCQSLEFDTPEEVFVWNTDKLVNITKVQEPKQSWSAIQAVANDLNSTPHCIIDHSNMLWYIILAFPHRANRQIIRILDT